MCRERDSNPRREIIFPVWKTGAIDHYATSALIYRAVDWTQTSNIDVGNVTFYQLNYYCIILYSLWYSKPHTYFIQYQSLNLTGLPFPQMSILLYIRSDLNRQCSPHKVSDFKSDAFQPSFATDTFMYH